MDVWTAALACWRTACNMIKLLRTASTVIPYFFACRAADVFITNWKCPYYQMSQSLPYTVGGFPSAVPVQLWEQQVEAFVLFFITFKTQIIEEISEEKKLTYTWIWLLKYNQCTQSIPRTASTSSSKFVCFILLTRWSCLHHLVNVLLLITTPHTLSTKLKPILKYDFTNLPTQGIL